MKTRNRKSIRDFNQLAKATLDAATFEKQEENNDRGKNPHAQALSKLGASKGGRARAKNLSAKRRTEIAKKAAQSRWKKD